MCFHHLMLNIVTCINKLCHPLYLVIEPYQKALLLVFLKVFKGVQIIKLLRSPDICFPSIVPPQDSPYESRSDYKVNFSE